MNREANRHLNEDELVLHFYRDGETANVADHLAACRPCREAFDRLADELGLADGLRVPERSASYGDEVWARVSAQVATEVAPGDEPTTGWRDWLRLPPLLAASLWPRTLAFGGALAALLAVTFWLGYGAGGGGATEPIPPQVRERILLVAVGDHLERSQRLLIELAHAESDGDIDVSSQREAAAELAGQNRLYRQTAAMGGDATVSEVLDELERLLVEIANGPDNLARNELAQLQRRIERRGILFKIRVIGNDVRQQEAAAPPQV